MAQAQGALSQIIAQRETSFKTLPSYGSDPVTARKIYFTKESLRFDQGLTDSMIIRGASRHPTQPILDKTDVAGGISSELDAHSMLYFAALGSIESAMTGGSFGSALTTPTAVIDSANCVMTITSTTHGLLPGDSVQIAGLTAPTSLNDKIFPVFDAVSANVFKIAIPVGTSETFTIGSGTIKKVTAIGTTLTHTIKAGGGLPSYTIEKGFTDIDQYFKYSGCVCATLSMSIPSSGIIPVETTWMGGAEAYGVTPFDTGTVIDNGKRNFHGLQIAAADIKEGSTPTAIAYITNIANIAIDNVLDGDTFVIGGLGARGGINPGVYKVSGSLTALFQDTTLYAKAKNTTESGLDITLKRGTGAGTDGNESFQIVIPELNFKPTAPIIEGPKGVVVTLDFIGYYENHADATGLELIIKNVVLPGQMV